MTDPRATLIFRATPWLDRSVRRVFELAPDHTLADLHRAIVDELQLDDDHLWAFYLSGEWFDRTSEFDGTPDFSGRAQTAKVGDLGLAPDDFVAYVCDFGDEQRVEVELLGYGEAPNLDRPRVLERTGAAHGRTFGCAEDDEPDEADRDDTEGPRGDDVGELPEAPRLDAEAGEVFRAALDAWDHGAADPNARISLDADRIAKAATAVLELCASPANLAELGWSEGVRLEAWLGDAIRSVAAHGDAPSALRIAEAFSSRTRMRQPLIQAALAFADAGRADAARAALDAAARADLPCPQSVRFGFAEVRLALGDAVGAEAQLRRLTTCRWPSPRIRPLAVGQLAALLDSTDRTSESRALLAAERIRIEALAGVVRRNEPRVGRNDPCPCGSGKKAKKCCGT